MSSSKLIVYNLTGAPVTLAAGNPARQIPASLSPPSRGPSVDVTSELRGLTTEEYAALESQRASTLDYEWAQGPGYPTATLVAGGPTMVVPSGMLSSDATGRAAFANNFFDTATLLAKFASNSFTNAVLRALIAAGSFVADSATRALFADGFVNTTLLEEGCVTPVKQAPLSMSGGMGFASVGVLRVTFSAALSAADDITIFSSNAPFGFRILDVQVLISATVALSTVQLRSASGGGGTAYSDAFPSSSLGRKYDSGSVISNVTKTVAQNGSLYLRRSSGLVAGEMLVSYCRESTS